MAAFKVSYFDEASFRQWISRQGLVCFDSSGKELFKYADFAGAESSADDLRLLCAKCGYER